MENASDLIEYIIPITSDSQVVNRLYKSKHCSIYVGYGLFVLLIFNIVA